MIHDYEMDMSKSRTKAIASHRNEAIKVPHHSANPDPVGSQQFFEVQKTSALLSPNFRDLGPVQSTISLCLYKGWLLGGSSHLVSGL